MVDASSCCSAWYATALCIMLNWNQSAFDGNIGFAAAVRFECKCTATNGSMGSIRRRPSFSIPSTSRVDIPCTGILLVNSLSFQALSSLRQQGADLRKFAAEFLRAAEGLQLNEGPLKDLFFYALDEPMDWLLRRAYERSTFEAMVEGLARLQEREARKMVPVPVVPKRRRRRKTPSVTVPVASVPVVPSPMVPVPVVPVPVVPVPVVPAPVVPVPVVPGSVVSTPVVRRWMEEEEEEEKGLFS
ncbi:hypothetical protein PO909_030167 [Leuciscus waleckii]